MISRGDVYLVALDPTVGAEIQKTRPCLVLSPNELNRALSTVIVAPMTTQGHPYPTRVRVSFERTRGFVVLDQLRTVDGARLVKRLGRLDAKTLAGVLDLLGELFAP